MAFRDESGQGFLDAPVKVLEKSSWKMAIGRVTVVILSGEECVTLTFLGNV